MSAIERRTGGPDRRRVPRGGRRASDRPGRHPHVLVADSYEAARVCCVKYLERLGFGVLETGNGSGALAHIHAQSAQVVVIEHGLPDAPVSDVAHRLRATSPAVPLIVMTSDLDVVGDTVTQLPLVTVLEKPFSLMTMIDEIRRLLRWTGREADADAPALL